MEMLPRTSTRSKDGYTIILYSNWKLEKEERHIYKALFSSQLNKDLNP